MKKIITTQATLLLVFGAFAQSNTLVNNGGSLHINGNASVQVNGDVQINSGSTLNNNGNLVVKGNITNNAAMANANTGVLILSGGTAQTIGGNMGYFAKDITINNANGVTLTVPLKVDGFFNLVNGIVTVATTANAVTFTSNGTVSNTNAAKDASHINGYVVKEGVGSFTYPIGNGIKYQPVTVNPTANATGLRARYLDMNAGTGTFTTTGTEAMPLVSYNDKEYWDITPLSTATGTVTIFWDGYKDVFDNPLSQRKVAHLMGGNWLNEGTTAIGTTTAGSVISNSISNWRPFTMGSITTVLPVIWLNINGSINSQKQPTINWQVQEANVINYSIEKSTDARTFTSIATVASKGNGNNTYQFTDATTLNGTAYFKIKQVDKDGRNTYSTVIKLSNQSASKVAIYPNPVKDVFTLTVDNTLLNTQATIVTIGGSVLQKINITQLQSQINIGQLSSGIYLLQTANGSTQKIIKQ